MTPSNQFGIACKSCRRRGRKCDRTLPTCQSCKQRGVPCEGYTLRWVGVASRGQLASQSFGTVGGIVSQVDQSSAHPNPKKSDLDLSRSLISNRIQHVYRRGHGHQGDMAGRQALFDVRYTTFEVPHAVSDSESAMIGAFLKIYAHDISTAFYLGHGPAETPYTLYILPMTQNIACIRYVAAATAASHVANRLHDSSLRQYSLHLRLKATEALRLQLKNHDDQTELSSLACMVLLAQLDLCSGDRLEFFTHLEAANEMISRRGSDGTDKAYFQQRLAWMGVIGTTTSPRLALLNPAAIKSALTQVESSRGYQWGFDVFDCPIGLFDILVDIISLQDLYGSLKISFGNALQRSIALGHAIKAWEGPDPGNNSRRDIVEVWRDGILLYLIRLFEVSNEIFGTSDLLEDIMQRGGRLSSEVNRKFATSWPLFQAGLWLDVNSSAHKQWLRDEFVLHFQTRGCYNAKLAIDVLDRIWKTGDLRIAQSQKLLF